MWDLRGLEHSVATCLIDYLTFWFEDTPYFDAWMKKRHRLDTPLSEFPKVFRFSWRRHPLSRVFCGIVQKTFGVRCTRWDVFGWRTVADAVRWVSSRLDPVYVEISCGFAGRGEDLAAPARDPFSAPRISLAWGPTGSKPLSEINEATPCWCGSGKPYFRCCGVDFLPKPQYACGLPAWVEDRCLWEFRLRGEAVPH